MRRLGCCVIVAGALAGSVQLRADEALPGEVGTGVPVDEVVIDTPDDGVITDDGTLPSDPGTDEAIPGDPIVIDDPHYEDGMAESGPPEGEVPGDDGTVDDGTVDDGTIEDGTVEDGIVEDGTVEDGTVVDGTVDDGVLYPGTDGGELVYTATGGAVGGPASGGPQTGRDDADAPASAAVAGSLSRSGLDEATAPERLPEGFPQPMDVIDSAAPQRKAVAH